MEFRRLTLDCIGALKPFLAVNRSRICDFTLGGTFIWRDYHGTEYAIEDGVLYLKIHSPSPAFSTPHGAKITKQTYDRIMEYCDRNNHPKIMCGVPEIVLEDIKNHYPNSKETPVRSWSDYLYNSADLINLSGRKYSGQRNHINRFTRDYTSWSYERIGPDNVREVIAFYEKYAREHNKNSEANSEGDRKALEVLANPDMYDMMAGGVLFVNRAVVGVSLGEIVGDTLFVHTEKADTAYSGAYPMVVNQFAKMFEGENIAYINREEDDGDEGLRTSKLSYHPEKLLTKYSVELA